MRVAVLGGYAPSLLNFRGSMMGAMVAAGHEVLGMAPEEGGEVADRLAAMGVRYLQAPLQRTGMNPLADLRSLRALTEVFRRERPELLLSYTIKPVIYGSMAAAAAGVPKRYAMITGLGSSLQGRGLKMGSLAMVSKLLYRRGLAATQGVLFQNPDDRAFFESNRLVPPGCRITMINGSGVDLDQFAQTPVPPGPPSFLMVARLTRDKGLLEFVEAARILRTRHPGLRCQVLGPFDSNPTGVSRAQVAAWEAEGLIEYLGETRDVRPFLAQAHVMVLPSYGEGTPRSVLEAMAVGRAVVTTSAPGCRETVVPDGNGFLVPVRDAHALAEAMGRFAEDPSLAARMGAASRAYAEDRYDVHKVNAVILQALGLDSGGGPSR